MIVMEQLVSDTTPTWWLRENGNLKPITEAEGKALIKEHGLIKKTYTYDEGSETSYYREPDK